MRFDWYQATIPENPILLVDSLLARLAPGGEVVEGKGRHNYHQSFTVKTAVGDRAALVLCGGPNGHPNVTASGNDTMAFVDHIRANWPEHRVTRFDSAEDFCEQGAFERIEEVCREVASECGVKGRAIVPDDLAEGKTYYMGAAASDVRVRLYDKTAEARRGLPPERASEVPDFWARLEAQIRPRGDFKAVAAKVPPEVAWGFAGWTQKLAVRAFAMDVQRIQMKAGRESDDQRAYRYMVMQYGPLLLRMLRDLGSWACVGLTIGEDVERIAREKIQR